MKVKRMMTKWKNETPTTELKMKVKKQLTRKRVKE